MSDDYFTRKGVRSTLLKAMLNGSPLHYRHMQDNLDDGDTPDRQMRRGMHAATLEPERWSREFLPYPGKTRSGKDWETWEITHPGITGLTQAGYANANGVAAAVRAHPVAGPLVNYPGAIFEEPQEWTDEATGLFCLSRPDLRLPMTDRTINGDLKTVGSLKDVERTAWRLDWPLQATHYVEGAKINAPGHRVDSCIIAVEDKPPYDVGVYWMRPEVLEHAERIRRGLLETIAECERTGIWPGRYQAAQVMDLPHWLEPEITDSRSG